MATPSVSVPDVDGVPAVAFAAGFSSAGMALLSADAVTLGVNALTPTWGLFQGGASIVDAESVTGVEYRKESMIADYPMEQGAFATYNKVKMPYDVRLRFTSGTDTAARAALIASLAAIADDVKLYDVVTPETVYTNVNVAHQDYRRTARNGVGLLTVDVWCLQIQTPQTSPGSSTAQPDGSTAVQDGGVTPTIPSTSSISSLNSANVAGPVQAAGG